MMAETRERRCDACRRWKRLNPDDVTAPEGTCGLKTDPGFWPIGYWPHTLASDGCLKFIGLTT
jgi:hypothetical protein